MPQYAFDVGELDLPGSGYLPTAGFALPNVPGLRGAYLLGGGGEYGLVNWADEDRPFTAVGVPVWEDGYAALSRSSGYLDTGIAETAAMTLMFIGKRATAVNTPFIGNYAGSANIGICVYSLSGAGMVGNADRGAGGGSVTVAGNAAEFRLYSLTVPASGAMTIRDHTAGVSTAGTQTGARVVETANTIRLGSFPDATFGGIAHITSALVCDQALSVAHLAQCEAWFKGVGAFYGMVV